MPLLACTLLLLLLGLLAPPSASADFWCEPAYQDCREVMVRMVKAERVRLDIAVEEIKEDSGLIDAIIGRYKGTDGAPPIPVRMLVEPRDSTPASVWTKLKAAGVPMRRKPSGSLMHWKVFIFTGQDTVEFAATNYTQLYLVPVKPYVDFTQDATFFSETPAIVRSFQRKFDDVWTDTVNFVNFNNAASPGRVYPLYNIDSRLNFVPGENFSTRSKPFYDAETTRIDVMMYKITEGSHADALIRAKSRGVPVRLIVEPLRYRNKDNVWQAYHIDRMYAAGIQIRDRAHQGFMHQKTTLLHGQKLAIFGSSNWTTESNKSQYEHNYFSKEPSFFGFLKEVFDRKWNSNETKPFVPQPPTAPVIVSPANGATGQGTTITLSWKPGSWAHKADIYWGTNNPPRLKATIKAGPGGTVKYKIPVTLLPNRTYYWQIVSKTMAGKKKAGPMWSFTT